MNSAIRKIVTLALLTASLVCFFFSGIIMDTKMAREWVGDTITTIVEGITGQTLRFDMDEVMTQTGEGVDRALDGLTEMIEQKEELQDFVDVVYDELGMSYKASRFKNDITHALDFTQDGLTLFEIYKVCDFFVHLTEAVRKISRIDEIEALASTMRVIAVICMIPLILAGLMALISLPGIITGKGIAAAFGIYDIIMFILMGAVLLLINLLAGRSLMHYTVLRYVGLGLSIATMAFWNVTREKKVIVTPMDMKLPQGSTDNYGGVNGLTPIRYGAPPMQAPMGNGINFAGVPANRNVNYGNNGGNVNFAQGAPMNGMPVNNGMTQGAAPNNGAMVYCKFCGTPLSGNVICSRCGRDQRMN